jgi:16S rRNA (guanine527-N7)-methyltransferase
MNLQEGLAALGIGLSATVEEKLAAYLALLGKWNRTYNLSAIRDPQQMVTHHLLDSLAVLPHLPAAVESLADVGSGAGVPGIPLAICRPNLLLASIEANQKKASFQQQAKIELGLDNLSIHCNRVEDLHLSCDAAISRAFSSLEDFVRQAGHLSGCLLAMKGVFPGAEIKQLPPGWQVTEAIRLDVPGLAAERHLIILGRI